MSIFTERTSKKIDVVFVLALITLFAATSLALVLIGAKQYRFVTNAMTENHEDRTTSSYLAEKIRQNDTEDAITICDLMGVPALSIVSTEEGFTFITYIYYYENYLREIVVTENSKFSLSSGEEIIALKDFNIAFENDTLIRADVMDSTGQKQILFFPIRSHTNGIHTQVNGLYIHAGSLLCLVGKEDS